MIGVNLERGVDEISSSRALRAYGVALGCANLLTVYYWTHNFPMRFILTDREDPLCWPFAANCAPLHFSNQSGPTALLWLFGGLAAVSAILFAVRSKSIRWACGALAACEALKLGVLLVDYRMLQPQHYMMLFASFAFLFLPAKEKTIKILLVLIYFWAGILKCNSDWLAGSLLDQWVVLRDWLPVWCVLAVALESGVAWLLLSSRGVLFWPALALVVFFHALSWQIVSYYYPLLMGCLISIFPLSRLFSADAPPSAAPPGRRLPAASFGWLAFFCALQAVPYLYPYDAALRGGGRLFYGLWQFSALPECDGLLIVHKRDGTSRFVVLPGERINVRLRCQPFVAWNKARNRCPRFRSDPDFVDFDLKLYSRRFGRRDWNLVVDAPRFCAETPKYRMFGLNRWIKKQGPGGGYRPDMLSSQSP